MIKTGILTYHTAHNYGALLQAYALRTVLLRYCDAEIVPYSPLFIERTYSYFSYEADVRRRVTVNNRTFSQAIKHLPHLPAHLARNAKMRAFIKNELHVKPPNLKRPQDFAHLPYEQYVLGSDQIWNPEFGNGFDPAYFGAYTNERARRVAYAASFGQESLDKKWEPEFINLLKKIDAISVRENSSVAYISKLTEKPVVSVPDPVFLLQKNDWEQQMAQDAYPEPYIFLYMTERNSDMLRYAVSLAEQWGIPILDPGIHKEKPCYRNHRPVPLTGPNDFLRLIRQAKFVITNSFHGMALAIILEKDFCLFPHSRLFARTGDVLAELGLQSRDASLNKDCHAQMVDWEAARLPFDAMRKRGFDFLRSALL